MTKKILFNKYYLISITSLFILALTIISFKKISSNDFWWHLKLGQLAIENKEWITKEIFSFTRHGVDWFNNTQIFDAIIWLIYKNFGYLGLFIARLLAYLTTFYFIWKTISYKNKNWQLLFFVFFSILSLLLFRSLYRPEILTYVYTVVYLYLLYTYKYTGKKWLYLIPLIQIIWVNTHLSFVTGIALIGIFTGAEFIRHLIKYKNLSIFKNSYLKTYIIIFILSIFANFISPYGVHTISWFWWIYSSQESLKNVGEWITPPHDKLFNLGLWPNLPYIIITWSSLWIIIKKLKKILHKRYQLLPSYYSVPWEDLMLFALFLYQSLEAQRFTLITTVIFSILLVKNWPQHKAPKWLINTLPLLALLIFAMNFSTFDKNQFGLGHLENRYPENAVKFIKDNNIPGNMLNTYNDGGYLIWAIYPDKKIAMDGRTPNVYDNDFYWRWRNIIDKNIRKQLTNKYEINFWLWANDQGIPPILWADDGWKLIYFDNLSTIYIKNTEANQELIDKFAYHFFMPNFNQKDITEACSEDNLITSPDIKNKLITELERGIVINPNDWLHHKNLALVYQNCQYNEKDLIKIEEHFLQASKLKPDDTALYYKLGFTYIKMNNNELALQYFKKAGNNQADYLVGIGTAQYNLGQYKKAFKTFLKVRKTRGTFDNNYYQTLARTYYMLDKNELSIEFHHRYIDLADDRSAETYTDLAQAYFYNNQTDKSIEYLNKALEIDPWYPLALEMQKIIKAKM